jgi:hypothetical protein
LYESAETSAPMTEAEALNRKDPRDPQHAGLCQASGGRARLCLAGVWRRNVCSISFRRGGGQGPQPVPSLCCCRVAGTLPKFL